MNKPLKSLLKTAAYAMDQFTDGVDRGSDLVSDWSDRGTKLLYRKRNHTGRTVGIFAAGLGLGVGLGMLIAPASGKQTRDSISEKVQDIGNQVAEHFGTAVRTRPTGTEGL